MSSKEVEARDHKDPEETKRFRLDFPIPVKGSDHRVPVRSGHRGDHWPIEGCYRLDGARNFKAVVPADVPVNQFWSVHSRDIKTAACLKGVRRVGLDSLSEYLKANPDGSTNIYFGPQPPEGHDSNWIPTQRDLKHL